jgi:DNA-binding response OmpR family regulator
MQIMIASPRRDALQNFIESLANEPDIDVSLVNSAEDALAFLRTEAPELVVIDEALPDMKPLELATALVQANAMINTAVITSLSGKEFHEQSEGLGVLCGVASPPGRDEALAVVAKLRGLYPARRS